MARTRHSTGGGLIDVGRGARVERARHAVAAAAARE
jgi:hypothetical protein